MPRTGTRARKKADTPENMKMVLIALVALRVGVWLGMYHADSLPCSKMWHLNFLCDSVFNFDSYISID